MPEGRLRIHGYRTIIGVVVVIAVLVIVYAGFVR